MIPGLRIRLSFFIIKKLLEFVSLICYNACKALYFLHSKRKNRVRYHL